MKYTTKAQIEDYLKNDIDSTFNNAVDRYISAMSRTIDQLVGYPVYRDTAETLKYDGSARKVQPVRYVYDITEVKLDEDVVEPVQWPYNSLVKSELRLEDGNYWNRGIANVEVTGTHSLQAELPEDIQHATTVLSALILVNVRDQNDGVASEKIGDYTVSFRDQKDRMDFEIANNIIMSFRPLVF